MRQKGPRVGEPPDDEWGVSSRNRDGPAWRVWTEMTKTQASDLVRPSACLSVCLSVCVRILRLSRPSGPLHLP